MRKIEKLVRNNIPKIIENKNKKCKIKILNNEEYFCELNKKLLEETNEYLASNSVEELADIFEVIRAILKYKKVPYSSFENTRKQKAKINGTFDKKIYLLETED